MLPTTPCVLDQETRRENLIFTLFTFILQCYTNTQISHSKLKWSLGPEERKLWLHWGYPGHCSVVAFSVLWDSLFQLPTMLSSRPSFGSLGTWHRRTTIAFSWNCLPLLCFLSCPISYYHLTYRALFLFLLFVVSNYSMISIAGSSGFIHCCVLRMMPPIDPQESGQTKWAV